MTKLSRRAVLRGAAATVVGVPLLECMLDDNGTAFADGGALPCRYVVFFCPTSLGNDRDLSREGLTPTRSGPGYDVRPVLAPLAELGLTGDVSVVSGLFAAPWDAPGGYNVDHHRFVVPAVLSGRRHGWDTSDEGWRPPGPSSDQIVADAIGGATRFPSLVFQIDPMLAGGGISFRREASGLMGGVEPQRSPARAYRDLFTGFSPSSPAPPDDLEQRLRVSSLSYVADRVRALEARVGRADRARLQEHFTHVRALEQRLASLAPVPMTGGGCVDPAVAADDPEHLSSTIADHDARADLFAELTRVAFACDLTRVVTIAPTTPGAGTGMRHRLWEHIGGLHGEVQHGGDQAELDNANRWFVSKYAELLAKLKNVAEGDSSILSRSAAVFVMEGGKGGRGGDGGGDPNHSADNMTMLVGGHAGGLRAGQHVVARDEHPAAVLNAAMRAVGVHEPLGEIVTTADLF